MKVPWIPQQNPWEFPAKLPGMFRATQSGGQPNNFPDAGCQALAKGLGYDKYSRDTENQYKMLGNVGKTLILVDY